MAYSTQHVYLRMYTSVCMSSAYLNSYLFCISWKMSSKAMQLLEKLKRLATSHSSRGLTLLQLSKAASTGTVDLLQVAFTGV